MTVARGIVAGLLAAAVVATWVVLSGSGGHEVVIETDAAPGVVPGLAVRAAGQRIGTIERATVTRDHRARLVLRIDDGRAWPLPVDSRLQLRVGGAIKFTDRYIDVRRGRSAQTVPDGGTLPAAAFVAPVDIDQLLFTFDAPTRAGLRGLLRTGGAAFGDAAPDLHAALAAAPPAIAQAREVVDDIGADPGRLATLVASTDRVTAAIETSRPGLDTLLDGAAATFAAVAREAHGLQRTLEQAPATLDQARGTLGRADGTLRAVDTLTGRLAPGVVELRRVAAPLRGTLERLVEVGPDARSTISTLGSAAPALDTLLDTAGGLMPRLRVIGRQGAAALSCIRPYAPDIAGLFTTWGSGIWANADSQDHYVRAEVGTYAFPNASPLNSEQLSKLEPGLSVNFPRAPGAIVDQPWYQPQCGIDATATNAAADPENRATAAYPPAFFTDHSNPDPAAGR